MYLGFLGFLHMHEMIGHYGGQIHPKMDLYLFPSQYTELPKARILHHQYIIDLI